MGFGAADFRDRFGIETNSPLAHPIHLGRESLGSLGKARQFRDQPAKRAHTLSRQFQLSGGAEVALDPIGHHRLRCRPHVEIRVERARHAFHHHHRFLDEEQLREAALFLTYYVGWPLGTRLNGAVEKAINQRKRS